MSPEVIRPGFASTIVSERLSEQRALEMMPRKWYSLVNRYSRAAKKLRVFSGLSLSSCWNKNGPEIDGYCMQRNELM